MIYVVGLGNPGTKYLGTRHNVGFSVLDMIEDDTSAGSIEYNKYWDADVFTTVLSGELLTCVYPQTFMNKTGDTIQKIVKDDTCARCIFIYDDISLPVGAVRIVSGNSGHGGHNGVKAILPFADNTIARIKIGVLGKHPLTKHTHTVTGEKRARYVLEKFPLWDRKTVQESYKKSFRALECLVKNADNVSLCMSEFNKKA